MGFLASVALFISGVLVKSTWGFPGWEFQVFSVLVGFSALYAAIGTAKARAVWEVRAETLDRLHSREVGGLVLEVSQALG